MISWANSNKYLRRNHTYSTQSLPENRERLNIPQIIFGNLQYPEIEIRQKTSSEKKL